MGLVPQNAPFFAVVNLERVFTAGVPDPDGDLIPAGVTTGGYRVQKVGPRIGKVLITEALVVDRQRKNFESFYNTCCALTNIKALPNSLVIPVQDSGQINVTATDLCTFQTVSVTESASFFSSNPAVADVGAGGGVVLGVGVGTATVDTELEYFEYPCVLASFADDTPTSVTPVITGMTPTRGLAGVATSVTITGSGFGTSPTVNAGSGITVTIDSASNTQIQARFTVASNAPSGNHGVTVTAAGKVSNSVNFFVQVPTSLTVSLVATLATGSTGNNICVPGRDFGIVVSVNYLVRDQGGTLIASPAMQPQEKVLSLVINGENVGDPVPDWQDIGPSGVPGTTQFTNSQGGFLDAPYGSCGSFPITVTFSQPISVLVSGGARYTLRTNSISITSSSQGHGSITNGSDIQKSR